MEPISCLLLLLLGLLMLLKLLLLEVGGPGSRAWVHPCGDCRVERRSGRGSHRSLLLLGRVRAPKGNRVGAFPGGSGSLLLLEGDVGHASLLLLLLLLKLLEQRSRSHSRWNIEIRRRITSRIPTRPRKTRNALFRPLRVEHHLGNRERHVRLVPEDELERRRVVRVWPDLIRERGVEEGPKRGVRRWDARGQRDRTQSSASALLL